MRRYPAVTPAIVEGLELMATDVEALIEDGCYRQIDEQVEAKVRVAHAFIKEIADWHRDADQRALRKRMRRAKLK